MHLIQEYVSESDDDDRRNNERSEERNVERQEPSAKRMRRDVPQRQAEFSYNIVRETSQQQSKRFRFTSKTTVFIVRHDIGSFENIFEVAEACDSMYEKLMEPYLAQIGENDRISVSISNANLTSDIYIPPRKKASFNREDLLDRIFTVCQSNEKFLLDGEFALNVTIMKAISGNGKLKAPESVSEQSRRKKSVVTIANSDNSCFLRALALGLYLVNNGRNNKKLWDLLRKDKAKRQEKEAKLLGEQLSILWDSAVGIDQLSDIQQKLQCQLIVVDAMCAKQLLFKGPTKDKCVYLEYVDNFDGVGHYNTITNIKGYVGSVYYCAYCHIGYSNAHKHMCENNCKQCNCNPKCIERDTLSCKKCFRVFYGKNCFENHKHICRFKKHCVKCKREYSDTTHQCDVYLCLKCKKKYKNIPHYCFIETRDKEKVIEKDSCLKIFVAYDIESTQSLASDNTYVHVPNLLISQTVCDNCWNTDMLQKLGFCNKCGKGENVFFGNDCVRKFCDYIFKDLAKKAEKLNATVYAFAHNSRGYDGHFILQEAWKRNLTDNDVIMNGRKILKYATGNIMFYDSLAFFLQPLSALPKAFGFNVQSAKGFFPHLFNKIENYSYIGPLPELQYFGVKYMKPEEAQRLQIWHNKELQNNYIFDFKKEIIKYCKNDVDILIKSIMVFRKCVRDITGLDPYTYCFTLASLGLHVYRTNYLKEETIGITPVNGYSSKRNQSKACQVWLDWCQHEFGVKIERECHIGNKFADGYDSVNRRVFEFFGCRFHGCLCYYPNKREETITQFKKSANQLRQEVEEKIQYYKSLNYKVIHIWECEYYDHQKSNVFFDDYCKERYTHYGKLQTDGCASIRESFFGGRTNNLRFYYECAKNEEICYVDFISLYPDVLKNRQYPLGHPTVVCENFDYTLQSYFGFVKCKILAPRRLYIPVLPCKVNNKLLFPLCITCASNTYTKKCMHSDKERTMVNTWTTVELDYALRRGYKLIEILEVLNYERKTDTLFKEYINTWLKIKQQASGWPKWCKTEKQRRQFILDYYKREGIWLEFEKIEKNEALRFIAKIMLNSFWGKLAQRANLPKTEIVHSVKDYYTIFEDEKRVITSDLMVTENTMLLTTEYKNAEDAIQANVNLAIASFVTAYARVKLLSLLEQIERQNQYSALYHDTDSVIYVRKFTDPKIETGEYLGELTNEFEEYEGAICKRFASLGPKNYGYEMVFADGTTKSKLKVKGLSLNENTLNLVNFKQMIEMAISYSNGKHSSVSCPQFNIQCDSHHIVRTRYFDKIYRATSDKRIIDGSITLPYGY